MSLPTTPVAYNPSTSPISGTTQIGTLAIGTTPQAYGSNLGGVKWWMGPDESDGYVIAIPVSGGNQPTEITDNEIFLSPTYRGSDINLSNNNQTAYQQFGYQQSVLGTNAIGTGDKVMFSVLVNLADPGALPDSHVIGVGKTNMNYQGSPYGGYPGTDANSMGWCSNGSIYFNGSVYDLGYPTWSNNDVLDIALNMNQTALWVRKNGGDWNNNPSANPATDAGAVVTIGGPFYPVLCPAYEGTMTIQNTPAYSVPTGYTFLGITLASVGFYKTTQLTMGSFVALVNNIFNQSFSTPTAAKNWLNDNGYWTSYPG
jgi:hypothetical protein